LAWLETEAEAAGHRSLRAVVVAMSKRPEWPNDRKIEAVANNLRALDRGEDPEWWLGRGAELVPLLAAAIRWSPDDLRDRLRELGQATASEARFWVFEACPAIRNLDLDGDDLPPGIPEQKLLSQPHDLRGLWWHAPPGAFKSLFGRFLRRRGWTTLEGTDWDSVVAKIPETGRVFIELGTSSGAPVSPPAPAVSTGRTLIVAAPEPAPQTPVHVKPDNEQGDAVDGNLPDRAPDKANGSEPRTDRETTMENRVGDETGRPWSSVDTPKVSTWQKDLLAWLVRRAKPETTSQIVSVTQLFDRLDLGDIFRTPGEVVEFIGVNLELGQDAIDSGALDEPASFALIHNWMRWAVERRIRERSVPGGDILSDPERGPRILVQAMMSIVRAGDELPLGREAWARHLPGCVPFQVDPSVLAEIASSGDVERLRRLVPPDAPRMVDTLRAIGALQALDGHALTLRPTWIANLVRNLAVEQLAQSGPEGLGAVLLHAEYGPDLFRRLVHSDDVDRWERVRVAIQAAAPSPESLTANFAAFVAVGIALLRGDEVEEALPPLVWTRQFAHTAPRSLGGLPLPIIDMGRPSVGDAGRAIDVWCLAAITIAEWLTERSIPVTPSAFDIWRGGHATGELSEHHAALVRDASSAVLAWHRSGQDSIAPTVEAAFSLGTRLSFARGEVTSPRHSLIPFIQHPSTVVRLAMGKLEQRADHGTNWCLTLEPGLTALRRACESNEIPFEQVIEWCWAQWTGLDQPRGNAPPLAWLRDHEYHGDTSKLDDAEMLWRLTPAAVLERSTVKDWIRWNHTQVLKWLPHEFSASWVLEWADPSRDAELCLQALKLVSFDHGVSYLMNRSSQGNEVPSITAILWDRFPDAMLVHTLELAVDAMRVQEWTGNQWTHPYGICLRAPNAQREDIIRKLGAELSAPTTTPYGREWVRRMFLQMVEARFQGWRNAFAALLESEGA
jgi:hypothetical protein